MSSVETHYSTNDIEERILAGLRAAGLDPDERLTPGELAALDHFHTGGLQASREMLAMVEIGRGDRVLDIGAGLAGCARFLAVESGCSVDCVEMSNDYCIGAVLLNRITGLDEKITVKQGSALSLPYPDNSFDVVWMQNVGMNIEDKQGLYQEIARVLDPGGRFVFQEVAAGRGATAYFPLPWASDPTHNFLLTGDEMQSIIGSVGLAAEMFEDVSESQPGTNKANSTPAAQGQLGLAIYVDNLAEKAGNAKRCLEEGQVRYVRGVFRVR